MAAAFDWRPQRLVSELWLISNGAVRDTVVESVPVTCAGKAPEDGLAGGSDYGEAMRTANGTVPAATTAVRQVGVGGISIGDVRAAVIAKAPQSVLGKSLLSRLKSFERRQHR